MNITLTFRVQRVQAEVQQIKDAHQTQSPSSSKKQTMFSDVLDSKLPESEKTNPRVADEAVIVVVAGTESTSRTFSTGVYHLLANKDQLSKLQSELDEAIPDSNAEIPLAKAESLPYLVRHTLNPHQVRLRANVCPRQP